MKKTQKSIKELTKNIEVSYEKEILGYSPHTQNIRAIDMVAIMMARRALEKGKIWWYSWELIGRNDEFFGSHKTPARFSDLAKFHPSLFESRPNGKYEMYRIKFEGISQEFLISMTKTSFNLKNII